MSIIDDLKFKKEANKNYKDAKITLKKDIDRFSAYISKDKQTFLKLKEWETSGVRDFDFFKSWLPSYIEKLDNNPDELNKAIQNHKNECMKWEILKAKAEKNLEMLRPNTKDDINERLDITFTFAKKVLAIDPYDTLNLRFHATSLSTTKDILNTGGIMSSVDRLDGFMQTTNLSNEISVSNIENIQYSIDYWADINAYQQSLPAGCMFVLQPTSQEEANMITGRQMHNVYFNKHPEQLVAIVTTKENVSQLQKWLSENGLDKNVACSYNEFPQILENKKEQLIPPYNKTSLISFVKNQKMENYNNDLAGKILTGQSVVSTPDNNEHSQYTYNHNDFSL
jgi:hypothetical protein